MNVIGVSSTELWQEMREYKGSLNWYKEKGNLPRYRPAKDKEEKIYSDLISSYVSGKFL